MAIQDVGSMNNLLESYNSRKWTQSADMNKALDFKDAPELDLKKTPQSFSEMLTASIKDVNGLQQQANNAIEKLATGKSKNLHETMLAVEKADIAFRTMNQIRMKVIDAYKEVMRMQL